MPAIRSTFRLKMSPQLQCTVSSGITVDAGNRNDRERSEIENDQAQRGGSNHDQVRIQRYIDKGRTQVGKWHAVRDAWP